MLYDLHSLDYFFLATFHSFLQDANSHSLFGQLQLSYSLIGSPLLDYSMLQIATHCFVTVVPLLYSIGHFILNFSFFCIFISVTELFRGCMGISKIKNDQWRIREQVKGRENMRRNGNILLRGRLHMHLPSRDS